MKIKSFSEQWIEELIKRKRLREMKRKTKLERMFLSEESLQQALNVCACMQCFPIYRCSLDFKISVKEPVESNLGMNTR